MTKVVISSRGIRGAERRAAPAGRPGALAAPALKLPGDHVVRLGSADLFRSLPVLVLAQLLRVDELRQVQRSALFHLQ